jgi:glycosyltransferase involved in cell wall biosynthesis
VPDVAALAADPRVTVTGTVDDIRPFLEEAGVYAAPLRFASGIQNKLLEAMAMAIPVVTTPIAVAGLAAPGGDAPPVRVAVGPEAFAAGILEALAERDANPAPDQVGREYVEARFGWPMAVARLEETLIQAVKGRAT